MKFFEKKPERNFMETVRDSFMPNGDIDHPYFTSQQGELSRPVGWGFFQEDGSIKRHVPKGAYETDVLDLNDAPVGTIFEVKGARSVHAAYRGRIDEIVTGKWCFKERKRFVSLWRDLIRHNFEYKGDHGNYPCEGLSGPANLIVARPERRSWDGQQGKIIKGDYTFWPYFNYELDKEKGLFRVAKKSLGWDEPTGWICVKYPSS
jgi:hypothetical protein